MKEDSTKDSTYALVKQLNISDNGNKSKIHLNYSLQSKNQENHLSPSFKFPAVTTRSLSVLSSVWKPGYAN